MHHFPENLRSLGSRTALVITPLALALTAVIFVRSAVKEKVEDVIDKTHEASPRVKKAEKRELPPIRIDEVVIEGQSDIVECLRNFQEDEDRASLACYGISLEEIRQYSLRFNYFDVLDLWGAGIHGNIAESYNERFNVRDIKELFQYGVPPGYANAKLDYTIQSIIIFWLQEERERLLEERGNNPLPEDDLDEDNLQEL